MRLSREILDEQQIFRPVTEEKGSRSSDLQLQQEIIGMALNDIKEMKETVDGDCKTFKKEVQEIRSHLNNAKTESESLGSELDSSFKRLKKMFYEDRPKKRANFLVMADDGVICDFTATVLERARTFEWESQAEMEEKERQREVPTIVDLLRNIWRELEDLGKKTKEKTDDMFKEIKKLKNEAHLQHVSLKSKNEGLDKKFLELEELIQGCCTINKIPLSILEGSRD